MAKHHGTRAASHVSGKRKFRDSTEEDDVKVHLISNALKSSKKLKSPSSFCASNSSYQTCVRSSPRMAEMEKAKKSGKQREAETAVLAKPIDVLAANMATAPSDHSDVTDPLAVFKGLTMKDLEDLHADIQTRLDVERMGTCGKYWGALLVVCDWEMKEGGEKDDQEERSLSFHSRIKQDVIKTLQGRSQAELESYQAHVESEMQLGRAEVVEYWKPILKHLCIYKARARLREFHTRMLDENCVRAQAASTQQAARRS